jgi:hypothetical protein
MWDEKGVNPVTNNSFWLYGNYRIPQIKRSRYYKSAGWQHALFLMDIGVLTLLIVIGFLQVAR